jgi:hypothetical protein
MKTLGLGFMALVGYALLVKDLMYSETVFILFSAVVNIILAALIVFRLIYHQRHVRNVLGAEHGSPYTNVMTMCVESSALMVITSGVYVALDFTVGNWYFWIPYLLYPHICVGGFKLDDIWCTAKIFDTTRLSRQSSSSIALH